MFQAPMEYSVVVFYSTSKVALANVRALSLGFEFND
jgi:hypothetical protein